MTVDVDVYDAEGEKVDFEELPGERIMILSLESEFSSPRKLHHKDQHQEDGGQRQSFPDSKHQ